MRDTTITLAQLIARYAGNGPSAAPGATLEGLGLDALDLPILALDIEDAFGVEMDEDALDIAMTLSALAELVKEARKPTKTLVPVSCRPWMETAMAVAA